MKFFHVGKDGGPKSTVTGYWLIELKSLFSVALLKFNNGSRDEYHTHAFNSVSWLLKGEITEHILGCGGVVIYTPSVRPIITKRSTYHRTVSNGTTWVLTFRGPWIKFWREYNPLISQTTVLADGRIVIREYKNSVANLHKF